jgi:hypothetical protein
MSYRDKYITIVSMVEAWLFNNGFNGLYNDDQCACKLDDLMPCGEPDITECHPGYLSKCDDECEFGDCDFHIVSEKKAVI